MILVYFTNLQNYYDINRIQGCNFNFFIVGAKMFAAHLKSLLGHIGTFLFLIGEGVKRG